MKFSPGHSTVIRGTASLVNGIPLCSHACHLWSQVVPGLWPDILCVPRIVVGALRYTWTPQHQFCNLWDSTTLGFWSDNSLILPEAPSDTNTFCWLYNVIFTGILHHCSILSYSPVIRMLNLVICYTHWTLGLMPHSGKCGTSVTSINGSFLV